MFVRVLQKLRKRGVVGVVEDLLVRLRKELSSEEVWLVTVKDLEGGVSLKRPTGIDFEDLRREHLPLLSKLNRKRDAPQIDERFAAYVEAGFQGFLALLDGAAIGYYWWVDAATGAEFPDLRDFGLGIELGPGEAYGSDFYLLPAHRDGRVAGEMLTRVENGLRERGYTRLWGYVAADNRPARWLYETRGYERTWTHLRKRRFFTTTVKNSPDPRIYKGGTDVDR